MTGSLSTLIRDLSRRRGRERRGLALAEGVRLVEAALAAGVPLRGVVCSPALEGTARGKALKEALVARGVPREEVAPAALDALADTEHPQGVVAVFEPRSWTFDNVVVGEGAVVLVLDGVQDPGNVGAILRTAWALGATAVVALKGTVDLTNPKVVRGSMGAIFHVPAVPAAAADFVEWARTHGLQFWISDADAAPIERPLTPRGRRPPLALVVGNEGAGVSPELHAVAHRRVAIRLVPGAESLNVAVAAGILLHEVLRDD